MNKNISIGAALVASLALSACGSVATSLKDGTYSHRQTYVSAEKQNFYIDVNTAIKNQKIESISVITDPNDIAAIKYAQEFKKGLQSKMIGKSLDSAKKMGYVSGASATSKAFSDALDAIQKEAQ